MYENFKCKYTNVDSTRLMSNQDIMDQKCIFDKGVSVSGSNYDVGCCISLDDQRVKSDFQFVSPEGRSAVLKCIQNITPDAQGKMNPFARCVGNFSN